MTAEGWQESLKEIPILLLDSNHKIDRHSVPGIMSLPADCRLLCRYHIEEHRKIVAGAANEDENVPDGVIVGKLRPGIKDESG